MKKLKIVNSRSQSQIIVSVLLILLVIVLLGFLGSFVFNFIKEKTMITNTDIKLSFSGEPFYNSASKSVCLVIERGTDSYEMSKLKIIVDTDRGEEEFIREDIVPKSLERIMYKVVLEGDNPTSVRIAGSIIQEGKERNLAVLIASEIVESDGSCEDGRVIVSDEELEDQPPAPPAMIS